MLGIDIVDLKDPLLSERNQRSMDFVQNSQDVLIEHPNIFWLLWASKEAVFKCRREPINFAPSKIPIQLKNENDQFTFESDGITGKFEINDNYIIALCGDLNDIEYHIFEKKDNDWSAGIRKMIVSFFKDKGREYTVGADSLNLPLIEPGESQISISHHGRFGAMAFSKNLI